MKRLLVLAAVLPLAACEHGDFATPAERQILDSPTATEEQKQEVVEAIEARVSGANADAADPFVPAPWKAPAIGLITGATAMLFKRSRRVLLGPIEKATNDPKDLLPELAKLPFRLTGLIDSERTVRDYLESALERAWAKKDNELIVQIQQAIAALPPDKEG